MKSKHIETIAVHGGNAVDEGTKAVVSPINLSTTYEREADGSYPKEFLYQRLNNPNRQALEECMAQLEGGVGGACFSSGNAAAMTVFQALKPGDHAIIADDLYRGIYFQIGTVFKDWNLEFSFVDLSDLDQLEKAIRSNTKLIWAESPSNPLLKITDLRAVADISHRHNITCIADNTFATPVFQKPLTLGFDLVLHSMTKYMGGHSDVLGGAIVAKEATPFFERIKRIQVSGGAVLAPFSCYLVLRGIRTLAVRLNQQALNAMEIAQFLNEHPKVEAVNFPGLPGHKGHDIAKNQMCGFGAMLSFLVKGGEQEAMKVAANVQLFTRATSLGGVESYIEHRASIEKKSAKKGESIVTPDNLLRLSTGLENSHDLIADLEQALET
ncbi:MAG: aminotransferase class I/II-fold pyridoxal phosphate-dependent enzyme [bacterium]|nr:aminotransferase class I/II-fold pyridoxal phosphate-dependent enzyme [bacterium]